MNQRQNMKRAIGGAIDLLLSRSAQLKLGNFILNRNLGEGVGDAELNGEHRLAQAVANYLRDKNAIVFDVGANVGNWSASVARTIGTGAQLFAFEPSPDTFAVLADGLVAAGLADVVTPVCTALSDDDGDVVMHRAGDTAETNSLEYRPGVTEGGEVVVARVRGDHFCASRGIRKVDFLKVDVEGHEFATLRGFEEMLSAHRVECIQFEYGSTWVDARVFLGDMFRYLQAHGYRVGKIMPKTIAWIATYEPALDNFRFANFLAVAPNWSGIDSV